MSYIDSALFGLLPGQRETGLGDPAIMPFVRVLSLLDAGVMPSAATALVAQDGVSDLLVARSGIRSLIPTSFMLYPQRVATHVRAPGSRLMTITDRACPSRWMASSWFTVTRTLFPGRLQCTSPLPR